jgi:hypothetical protein
MGILKRIFGQASPSRPDSLVGCWHLSKSDDSSLEPAEMDFRSDGRLFYSIDAGDKWQVMKLVWRVDGDVIVTNQPTSPREERTRFSVDEKGDLVTEFGGQRASFHKGPKKAPEV